MSAAVKGNSRFSTHREQTVSFYAATDAKEQVRQATDIVDLISKSIPLRRQGRLYVGLCPWHDDTRPSLQVNPERQSWKCWVCDVGGDVFSFVMKLEGVSFPEALAMLADRAGIDLRPRRGRQDASGGAYDVSGLVVAQGPATADSKRNLLRAMAWAEQQYHECLLRSPEAEPARRYLGQRGITQESIQRFHLGYSPNRRDWILRKSEGTEFGPRVLEAVGILTRGQEGGSLYDRFRGRVLFSIRDPQDRPVGFGGRILPDSDSSNPAKYINSPETPLFSKSALLYGLDVAREVMRKSRVALVMEGYTDCIVAHQCGFGDAVAVLGTALGPRHIQTLKRFVDRIVLVLDGDEAGQRRTNEVLELFVSENVDLRIVTLPEGLDPCDFLLDRGPAAFGDLLAERAVDALEHAFRSFTRGIDLLGDVHAASQALERLVAIVAKAPRLRADSTSDSRFREEKILQRLAASFRVPEQEVRRRLTDLRRMAARRPGTAESSRPGAPADGSVRPAGLDPWQRELLEVLLLYPGGVEKVRREIPPEQWPATLAGTIYRACCRLSEAGVLATFERLMVEFDDPAAKSLLVELDEKGRAKAIADPEALLTDLIRSYRRRAAEKHSIAAVGALREGRLDGPQQLELLRRLIEQGRARHGISEPTDG